MRVLLANPRGFCAGVEMAIESVERALTLFGTPLYVYHEIVHNQHVVDHFRQRGVVFVESLDEVPAGSHLIYSAHGVSPEVRREAAQLRLHAIDATCPLVAKVHGEVQRFAREGYTIVLVGHAGHDEVVGTVGEAPERIRLVESVEDVDQLAISDPNRIAYLTQTTLSVDDASRIIQHLQRRFPGIIGPARDDICYATQNRQEAIKTLLDEADAVIVVGSRNSSNSNRLVELARTDGKPAHLVDSSDELQEAWFSSADTVLVTAGASAPESLVQDCIAWLRDRFDADVEERLGRLESAHFPLPLELRSEIELPKPSASRTAV
ncbi:MAG TPA: 4-hydroxy-3-methylbut-2-enyl diphosphate reductase [Planctomycetaceae bacterium]|nr:4-hydroxy-3-methylbut-2-enyl diphosphate reductase [Planctomycetaceae bacterium]